MYKLPTLFLADPPGPQTPSAAADTAPLLSPFVHSPPADDESEYWDENDEPFFASADLTTPHSTPPPLSCWSKQDPSTTCKIAYVLFSNSGQQESLGVYYNWYNWYDELF